jgi:hypothetical protein
MDKGAVLNNASGVVNVICPECKRDIRRFTKPADK